MKTLRVDLDARAYEIRIAPGLLDAAGEHLRGACPQAARLFVVTDSTVGPLYPGAGGKKPDVRRVSDGLSYRRRRGELQMCVPAV